jgi:hypothetical protein
MRESVNALFNRKRLEIRPAHLGSNRFYIQANGAVEARIPTY